MPNQKSSTSRIDNNGNQQEDISSFNKNIHKKSLKKWQIIIIISSIVLIVVILVVLYILLRPQIIPECNESKDCEDGRNQEKNITKEEALKAFESSFKVISKIQTLTQLLMKHSEKQISITNGEKTSFTSFSKTLYDIYTLNESLPTEEEKKFISKKYYTIMTINSQCKIFYAETDCQLETVLDLNIKNRRNLGRKDEEDPDIIRQIFFPICIIEHSDTNIILSVTCPETLSSYTKKEIITAFQSIKPDSSRGLTEDKSIADTSTETKDDKIYIHSFSKVCETDIDSPKAIPNCETTRNIITDKEGNLISINKTYTSELFQDENNQNIISKIYYTEDISDQNSDGFNPLNYKNNLDIVLGLIKSLLKKEEYISSNTFNIILDNLIKEDTNSTFKPRKLIDNELYETSINEKDIFKKFIYGIELSFKSKNDLGQGYMDNAKAISSIITGDKSKILSDDETDTKLNQIINEFVVLSKAGNMHASSLFEEINEPLLNLRECIDSNLKSLIDSLTFVDLATIFDTSLSIDSLQKLPDTLVVSSQNLYDKLNQIYMDIDYIIDSKKMFFKKKISSFLSDSHKYLLNIFSNLTEATNLLSSSYSKIAEVSSYYLNDTDTSYSDIIIKVKEIFDNYYKKEIDLIVPLVNNMLMKFWNESPDTIKIEQSNLDTISEKLKSGVLSLNSGKNEESKKVIDNIKNSKIILNDIIENIATKFNNSIGIQNTGYFETEKYLDDNNKTFYNILEESINVAKTLDDNSLVDKTFDNIMIYFREQFIILLNNMENSKRQNFPLKENILFNSSLSQGKINEIDKIFQDEKIKIINFVKNENKNYLEYIGQIFESFNKEKNLDEIINYLQVILSELNLDNLKQEYDKMLNDTMKKIDNIIKGNKQLAVDYFKSIDESNPIQCTSTYKNKYKIYTNNIDSIINYIKYNFKSVFLNKYKDVINNIRSQLQIIKSNTFIQLYYNSLPFAESHFEIIKDLFLRLDKYISDDLFNINYLPIIENYITKKLEDLNSHKQLINNYYSKINNLEQTDSDYDYIVLVSYSYRCCKAYFMWCWRRGTCYDSYYEGYSSDKGNNHLKLEIINFDISGDFNSLFSTIYVPLKNNITSYNKTMNEISNPLESKKKEILSKNVEYLNNIPNEIDQLLNDVLDNNLLIQLYNYYKNELSNKLPIELDDFLEQWKNIYDNVDEYLNSNMSYLKSNIEEFYSLGSFYYVIYKGNISYDYVNSIVEQRKNDLNYAIKYYYNMIISKVNKTFSYILNNIPLNNKPFNEILEVRENDIKNTYNNILHKIEDSKTKLLSLSYQLSTLNITENNFFSVNNITNDNVNRYEREILEKLTKIEETIYKVNKIEKEELIIARFYEENSQNGNQIKQIYESIDKATFTDLQTDVYKNLIDEIYEVEQDQLIKNILTSLNEFNENISNSFIYEKNQYNEIIRNKTYKEFFTKEKLVQKINELYSNGLNNLNSSSKNTINGYLDEILNNIKTHISNEAARLSNELTSYSNNYEVIENTLNNIENNIYNQYYSTVSSEINNFYSEIINKFYTNYIEKYLPNLEEEALKENFGQHEFLNTSINLNETIHKIIKTFINEYRNLTLTQIDYLNDKYSQQLNDLFSFESIKNKINREINDTYISKLLPALKEYATYIPGDEGVTDYDFSTSITNNIDNIINNKIIQITNIVNKMKGKGNIINEKWNYTDFSEIKRNEFNKIKNLFQDFCDVYDNQEKNETEIVLLENININFNNFINGFIPSFGKDFFERILRYNEIQKIKLLYNNLKYSLTITLIYYIQLCNSHTKKFPKDLKNKIISLNNIESTVKSKNEKVLSTLNSKIEQFFDNTKNYLVEKYISQMKNDPFISNSFNEKIKAHIDYLLNGKRYIFEEKYIYMMNSYIKEPFMKQYSDTLNKESKDMLNFIEDDKEVTKGYLMSIFTLNTHDVIIDIENKLNNLVNAISEYNTHFDTFEIPSEVINYLNNFVFNEIKPKYKEIENIMDNITQDLLISNLENNSLTFKNNYIIQNYESQVEEINNNITNISNKITESLQSYGLTKDKYVENLQREKAKYQRIRRLDDLDSDKMNYNQKIINIKIENTFSQLKYNSLSLKTYFDTLNLFNEFEEKIKKYINNINYSYSSSINRIKNFKDYYDILNEKLQELYQLSIQYYNRANLGFCSIKELIKNLINKINNDIEESANITYNTISNMYIEIKDNFPAIKKDNYNKNDYINIDENNVEKNNNNYFIVPQIYNYFIENVFMLDFVFENGSSIPKIFGNITNNNRPEQFEIDFYTKSGKCEKMGRRIKVLFNNISLLSNFSFDAGDNNFLINNVLDIDEYEIKTEFYETKENKKSVGLSGISFQLQQPCHEIKLEVPEGEKEKEIVKSTNEKTNKTYIY